MVFEVSVDVQLKAGVSDPQGQTVERSLPSLGFDGVTGVRVGKSLRFTLDAADEASARAEVEQMCDRFLANPVIEESTISLTVATPT